MTTKERRLSAEVQRLSAELWNSNFPIGTPVNRYKLINPLQDGQATKTRSEAWLMGGHTAMVMVEGVSGGVALESVVPIDAPDPAGVAP